MEANNQIPVDQNNFPEMTEAQRVIASATIKVQELREAHKSFGKQMMNSAEAIRNTAETAERVFGKKGFL